MRLVIVKGLKVLSSEMEGGYSACTGMTFCPYRLDLLYEFGAISSSSILCPYLCSVVSGCKPPYTPLVYGEMNTFRETVPLTAISRLSVNFHRITVYRLIIINIVIWYSTMSSTYVQLMLHFLAISLL